MDKYHIQLTEEEQTLVAKIDLRGKHPNHNEGHAAYLQNKDPILTLLKSLSARQAVPQARLNWWNDPQYHPGQIKSSRKGLFERNGNHGSEIYTNPHFIPYLRYFLYGPDLPDGVIDRFEAQVGNPDYFTSGDVIPLGKTARDLTRQHRLDKHHAAGEFFKLCLDIGLAVDIADSVRRDVMQIR